jgi:hypothetical protein
MQAMRCDRPVAVLSQRLGRRQRTAARRRHGTGATTLFASGLALLLAAALLLGATAASAAPPRSAQPQGSAQGLLALLALQQAQLTAGDGAANDFFGYSVAIAGDTALVGAYNDGVGANTSQGSAYVFTRSGSTWSQQAKLTANDGAAGDYFGVSVAIAGETALVGAFRDDVGANPDQGSAYVFSRSGATWSQQTKLTANDGAANDRFGWSVAIAGETALVGAYYDDVGANTEQGSAYVFSRAGSTWSQQAKLTAAPGDGAAGDYFGYSVAIAGDTALVGAPYDTVGANARQGSAYVFSRAGSTWSQQAKLTAAPGDGAAGDYFGYSVAIAGETALVGAHLDDVGANTDQGSAYVFTRAGSTWSQQAKLTADAGAAGDYFGVSVAIAGETALVGANYDDVGANANQGSAYVFSRSGTTWSFQARLTAGDGAADDRFGHSVAIAGETALVGALSDDVGANTDQGSAYAFLLDGAPPTSSASFGPAANAAGWNNAAVTVTLAASDAISGIASTEYRLQGAAAWTPYTGAFPVTTQGQSTWEYRSTDLAGNVEASKSFTVKLDSQRPTTKAFAAKVRKGKTVKLGYQVVDAGPGCGSAKATIKIYKGRKLKQTLKAVACATNVKKTVSWKATLPKGTYTIKVFAIDIAGNVQSKVGSAKVTIK